MQRFWNPRNACLPLLLIGLALLASCQRRPATQLFATGLNQPRGMAFDKAGNLYVTEAGAVDAAASDAVSPIINQSSRLLRISPDGQIDTVLDGLPFTNYIAEGDIGAADVALLGGNIYLLTGEGYDDQRSRAILHIEPDGSAQRLASIRRFVESIAPPDSLMGSGASHATNPFAMIPAPDGQALYISDGASGRVLHVTLEGSISLFAELPHQPPLTGLTFGTDGRLYVAMLSALPLAPGNGAIWTADPSGTLTVVVPELTLPIDVGFDAAGRMYILEFSAVEPAAQPYVAGSGRLLRLEPDATQTVILDRLNYPTAMLFSESGDLYITVSGAFSLPGEGAVLRVPCRLLSLPDVCLPLSTP